MIARCLVGAAAAAVFIVLTTSPPAAVQNPATQWTPPRTPWGDPDLQGVWTSNTVTGVPLERAAEFGERLFLTDEEFAERQEGGEEFRTARVAFGAQPGQPGITNEWFGRTSRLTSFVVDPADGRIPPLTPEEMKRREMLERARVMRGLGPRVGSSARYSWDSWEDADLWDRCITRGLPVSYIPTSYNNSYRILQVPGYVVIQHEMLERRIIPLDGRPHLDKKITQWLGDPRGHWEGDTLVVNVINFSEKTDGTLKGNAGGGAGGGGSSQTAFVGSGASLHLIERFRRVAPDTLEYEATVDDPTTWTKPWVLRIPLGVDPRYEQIFEYACHEGNYAVKHMLEQYRNTEKANEVAR